MKLLLLTSILLLSGCYATNDKEVGGLQPHDGFADQWYQGLAEVNTYTLEQERYGEIRDGHAVLVFVTEDISRARQVKLDHPDEAGDDAVKVLKLNAIRKFNTGVYRYSMMTSVFSPVEGSPHALKTTVSSQEWCGHTWMQMNRRSGRLQISGYSYFEKEGDRRFSLPVAWTEDELWNLIRIDPGSLPTGEIEIIPSGFFTRLHHLEPAPYSATTQISKKDGYWEYQIDYQALDRILIIRFEEAAPFRITAWEERYPSGRNPDEWMETKAELKAYQWLDYWNHNSPSDSIYRHELGLD